MVYATPTLRDTCGMMKLGVALKQIRTSRSLIQVDVARDTAVAHSTLSTYENLERWRAGSTERLNALLRLYGGVRPLAEHEVGWLREHLTTDLTRVLEGVEVDNPGDPRPATDADRARQLFDELMQTSRPALICELLAIALTMCEEPPATGGPGHIRGAVRTTHENEIAGRRYRTSVYYPTHPRPQPSARDAGNEAGQA